MVCSLGSHLTHLPGYPNAHKYRIVDLYTRRSTEKAVLEEFVKIGTHLSVVVATTAFGMGVDCPNIRQVIHWGSPCILEEYVQETRWAGRDSEPCHAILAYKTL